MDPSHPFARTVTDTDGKCFSHMPGKMTLVAHDSKAPYNPKQYRVSPLCKVWWIFAYSFHRDYMRWKNQTHINSNRKSIEIQGVNELRNTIRIGIIVNFYVPSEWGNRFKVRGMYCDKRRQEYGWPPEIPLRDPNNRKRISPTLVLGKPNQHELYVMRNHLFQVYRDRLFLHFQSIMQQLAPCVLGMSTHGVNWRTDEELQNDSFWKIIDDCDAAKLLVDFKNDEQESDEYGPKRKKLAMNDYSS